MLSRRAKHVLKVTRNFPPIGDFVFSGSVEIEPWIRVSIPLRGPLRDEPSDNNN